MSRPPRHPLFAVCAPGLEALLVTELEALGIRRPRPRTGGVSFDATTRQLYAVNLSSRLATRVVLRVARFRARTFAELEVAVREIEWPRWLVGGGRIAVRATSTGSQLYHTGAIAERVERFAAERMAASDGTAASATAEARPPLLVVVRVVHDEVTISVDTSGEPLYKRGWRQATAKAPLRETLAAAMVVASGWDPSTPLVDPMCGSGTIVIEGALRARRIAPGLGRSFAFSTWPTFEPGTWASVAGAARAEATAAEGTNPVIVARDRDAGAITAAGTNAERAGVRNDLDLARASISDLRPPEVATGPGWILTNPPYGERVQGGHDLRDLYARFGDVLRASFRGWSVGLLVADPALATQTRLALDERWQSTNGGIPVQFLVATV